MTEAANGLSLRCSHTRPMAAHHGPLAAMAWTNDRAGGPGSRRGRHWASSGEALVALGEKPEQPSACDGAQPEIKMDMNLDVKG